MVSLEHVNQFLLSCGRTNNLYQFTQAVLDGIKAFCSYDQATAYFYDGNMKIIDRYLVNFDAEQSDVFLKYYVALSHAIPHKQDDIWGYYAGSKSDYSSFLNLVSWEQVVVDEFVGDYIRARRLKHSAHFLLRDANGRNRTIFALDRTQDVPFSAGEAEVLQFVLPHLNNLHKNFFLQPKHPVDRKRALMAMAGLTARETEIACQLCDGVSPANISTILHISPATTHKHIAHIYAKMRVSNLQELLVRLLNPYYRPSEGDGQGME